MKHRYHIAIAALMLIHLYPICLKGNNKAEESKTLVMFWNLENFFDWKDSGQSESDREFSSKGERAWTWKRFITKCNSIAKTIFSVGEEYGRLPDVIGLAEVENIFVIKKLLYDTLLAKIGYSIVHFDSNDSRGIDTALLYRKEVFSLVSAEAVSPKDENGKQMSTRDILTVILMDRSGRKTAYIVNHHPSKYGGEKISQPRREAVMKCMAELCDSLHTKERLPIVSMGDFNDTPDGPAFRLIRNILCNQSDSLFAAGKGTIRYNGKWDLIDMFLTAGIESGRMEIYRNSFLMTEDRAHTGYKPRRTYLGPRYNGGVSDHLPIIFLY